MNEIKHYRTIRVDLNEDSCPLKFYKMYQLVLPYMSRIASMVFCVTASSVPSECVFSAAGQLLNVKRTRLHPDLAEELLMLNINKFE